MKVRKFWEKVVPLILAKPLKKGVLINDPLAIVDKIEMLKKEGCPEVAQSLYDQLKADLLNVVEDLPTLASKSHVLLHALDLLQTFVKHQQQLYTNPSSFREWVKGVAVTSAEKGKIPLVHVLYRKVAGSDKYIPYLFPARWVILNFNDVISRVAMHLKLSIEEGAPYPLSEWVRLKPIKNATWVVDWLPGIALYLSHSMLALSFLSNGRLVSIEAPFRDDLFEGNGSPSFVNFDLGKIIQKFADVYKIPAAEEKIATGRKLLAKMGYPCREGRMLLAVRSDIAFPLQGTPKGLLKRGIVLLLSSGGR